MMKLKSNWLTLLAKAKLNGGLARPIYGDRKSEKLGFGHGSGGIRLALRNRGLIDADDRMTDAGYQALEEARRQGF